MYFFSTKQSRKGQNSLQKWHSNLWGVLKLIKCMIPFFSQNLHNFMIWYIYMFYIYFISFVNYEYSFKLSVFLTLIFLLLYNFLDKYQNWQAFLPITPLPELPRQTKCSILLEFFAKSLWRVGFPIYGESLTHI